MNENIIIIIKSAQNKAFEKAEFIPHGLPPKILLQKLKKQNKYVSNITAFPIIGVNNNTLKTEITTEGQQLTLREYITRCARAEKLEPTQTEDRWLLVMPKDAYEHAINFTDNTLHDLFTTHPIPRTKNNIIPHRPGSRHTRSSIFNQYADNLTTDATAEPQYSRPPARPRQSRLNVSYAAIAAKPIPKTTSNTTPAKKHQQIPAKETKKLQQSVRQQIHNNSVEIKADLEAQVRALQSQIQSLQTILTTLQQQVQLFTTQANATSTIGTTTHMQMEVDQPSTSPRAPASKRPRTNQSKDNTSETEPNFEDSVEDPTTKENWTQPTPPTDPNHGLDPGEEDSTL